MSTTGDELQNGRGYPRPQLRREGWRSLDGSWQFAIDEAAAWRRPEEVRWERLIRVPFSPETAASGVAQTSFFRACWYRHRFSPPEIPPDHHVLLHFGAVDYEATVWLNGRFVGRHQGGYTRFTFDITPFLNREG